jgi:hypothetical protein
MYKVPQSEGPHCLGVGAAARPARGSVARLERLELLKKQKGAETIRLPGMPGGSRGVRLGRCWLC